MDWTLIFFVTTLLLTAWEIYQFGMSKEKKKGGREKARTLFRHALGLRSGLLRIVQDAEDKRYTERDDISNAVWALYAIADELRLSLYEDAAYGDGEFVEEQQELRRVARTSSIKKHQEKKITP